jgi:endothelin-converting enzyme/putative endopeptidase
MRRLTVLWSVPALALVAIAAACDDTPPPATAANPPPAPVASAAPTAAPAPAAPSPHAPPPPVPAGVEQASMDTTTSPCDDFFQYSCGGWVKNNPIPDDQSSWTRFNALAEDNMKSLKDILEKDATNPPADEAYSKALGDYYATCMDEAAAEKDGIKGIAPELARINGVHDATSLARELARMHSFGAYAFFAFGSGQDFKDATSMIGDMDQRGLGMPDRDYYLKDDAKSAATRDKYVAHLEAYFGLLGDKPEAAKKEAKAVFELEKALATDQISRVDHRDPMKIYHKMTPAELAKAAPSFKWDAYLKDAGLKDIKAINVEVPDYVTSFDKRIGAATKDSWAGEIRPYLRVALARAYATSLSKAWVDEDFAFKKELTGQEKVDPRWRRCVRAVDRGMGEALAIPFVKQKFGDAGKQASDTEIKAIEAAMQADLATVTWMDDATRAKSIEKVKKVANMVGFPDKWRNYDALKIDRKSGAANNLRAAEFESHRDLGKIGKPVDRGEWEMSPPTVNAYYEATMNHMVFPAGILQSPFFAVDRPQAVNIGAIGVVMGHELTHGFDDKGRLFDADGNMSDWWTPSVSTDFEKRASCVADQFDGYIAVDDVHVNGKLTLGENIADLGGLKLALSTLHQASQPSPDNDRAFFIAYAQVWCGARRPDTTRMLTRVDPHSPPRWRVNGPLSNLPEFATAFSCEQPDAMVRPKEKACTVW